LVVTEVKLPAASRPQLSLADGVPVIAVFVEFSVPRANDVSWLSPS
jgi:hypothetical protein